MRSCRRLASVAKLVLCALRFAARLAELLLRLAEFALEAPQLALQPANLTLDSFDPDDRGILRLGCGR